mgnify:CR=1 FL=1
MGNTIVEAGSGTHPLLAGILLRAPAVTVGVATVTDTASLYIAGAPSATVTGNNYSLLVGGGLSNFGGVLTNSGMGAATTGTTVVITGASNEFRPLTSSRRFKENIRPWTKNPLTLITRLPRPVLFDYKDVKRPDEIGQDGMIIPGAMSIGGKNVLDFLAEDVYPIIPEAVNVDDSGLPYSFRFDALTAILIAAVQEQQKQIDDLNRRVP